MIAYIRTVCGTISSKTFNSREIAPRFAIFYAQGLFSKWDHLNNFSCFLLPRFFAKPWLNKFWCDESTFLHDFKKYTKKETAKLHKKFIS